MTAQHDPCSPQALAEMFAEREAIARIDGGLSPCAAAEQARTDTEAWRHQCEVRWVLRGRCEHGPGWRDQQMADARAKRGPEMADKLHRDCAEQWARGNRGAHGDWR